MRPGLVFDELRGSKWTANLYAQVFAIEHHRWHMSLHRGTSTRPAPGPSWHARAEAHHPPIAHLAIPGRLLACAPSDQLRRPCPNGRLKKGEPRNPKRQGVSTARVMPIRGPTTISTGAGRNAMANGAASKAMPSSAPVAPSALAETAWSGAELADLVGAASCPHRLQPGGWRKGSDQHGAARWPGAAQLHVRFRCPSVLPPILLGLCTTFSPVFLLLSPEARLTVTDPRENKEGTYLAMSHEPGGPTRPCGPVPPSISCAHASLRSR